ncbi:hypothetical protein BSKO_11977 [Bryopsis sp. KO-2023]|nr:hypothetical protein BSKO_11977 [Bryopsis sp. KO-2023]
MAFVNASLGRGFAKGGGELGWVFRGVLGRNVATGIHHGDAPHRSRAPSRKTSWVCGARELTEEDLIALAGSKELYEEAMKDEEDDEILEIPFEDFPQRPRFSVVRPRKGERFAAYHRQTLGKFSKGKERRQRMASQTIEPKPKRPTSDAPSEPLHDLPIPWHPRKRQPPPPLVNFPKPRDRFVEEREYRWPRGGYISFFEKLYPEPVVDVQVTLTNDPEAVDEWAAARKREGISLYGFETKFWTFEDKGTFYSDTYPGRWSDLALLQIATEKKILLIQTLDMPVEKLGSEVRSILSLKLIKKCGYWVMPKAKAMKMCDLPFHGVHDIFVVLKRAVEITTKKMLPLNVEQLDLAGMSMHLLGIDLEPEFSAKALWEKEYLDEEMIEIAAREAWCCWALYGIMSRMTKELVILWSKGFPKAKSVEKQMHQKELRKAIMLTKSTSLDHVKEEQLRKAARRSLPKMSKNAAAELVLDAGIDLFEAVDMEELDARAKMAEVERKQMKEQRRLDEEAAIARDEARMQYNRWGYEVEAAARRKAEREQERQAELAREKERISGQATGVYEYDLPKRRRTWRSPLAPERLGESASNSQDSAVEAPDGSQDEEGDAEIQGSQQSGSRSAPPHGIQEELAAVDDFDQAAGSDDDFEAEEEEEEEEEEEVVVVVEEQEDFRVGLQDLSDELSSDEDDDFKSVRL